MRCRADRFRYQRRGRGHLRNGGACARSLEETAQSEGADREVVPGHIFFKRLRRPARRAHYARFRIGEPIRPADPLADDRRPPRCCGTRGFRHRPLQPEVEGAGDHIRKAQAVILRHREPATPVGIVRAATRPGERVVITDLSGMPFDEIDMQTTVIVGNSKTTVWNGMMITPRGYENKERE